MAVEWFCQVMGSEVGPLNQDQLVEMVRHHQINPEDLVRRGNSPWVPAFEVKGLFEAAAKPAPSPPSKPAHKDSSAEDQEAVVAGSVCESASDDKSASIGHINGKRWKTHSSSKMASGDSAAKHIGNSSDGIDDWFCIATGEKKGPIGFDELQKLADDGSLRGRDRVWRGSWPKFQKASEVGGLNLRQ